MAHAVCRLCREISLCGTGSSLSRTLGAWLAAHPPHRAARQGIKTGMTMTAAPTVYQKDRKSVV